MASGAAARKTTEDLDEEAREQLAERAAASSELTEKTIPADVLALWRETARDPRRRRQLARQSVLFFAWYYLRARGKRVSVPKCHQGWYHAIGTGDGYRKTKQQRKMLLLAPRSHGKSHVSCWVVPLHRICFNRNIRILILGASMEAAMKWLRRIRTQLENNPRILADFGKVDLGEGRVSTTFRDKGAPWTDHKIQVQRSDESLADATVEAAGAGKSITGGRFDLIIADDPESDKTVLTEHVRKHTRSWFRTTIQELLEPWGEFLVIGTRKHNDDLYAHLIKDRTFRVVQTKAIFRWRCSKCKVDLTAMPKPRCAEHPKLAPEMVGDVPKHEWVLDQEGKIIGVKVLDADRPLVLWPEVWPLEALLWKRESVTSVLFARENQNEVISDENATFQKEWLDLAKEKGLSQPCWASSEEVPSGWVIVQAWDPAFVDDEKKAQDADSDYFVGITVAVNLRNWHRRILRCYRGRGRQPSLFIARIKQMAGPFAAAADPAHPAGSLRWVVVERNSFGKFYELGLKATTDLPLRPHSTTVLRADKFDGVDAMAALFENGMISWARKPPPDGASAAERRAYEQQEQFIDEMYQELYGLGAEAHDDTVMALWLAEIAIRKFRRTIERQAAGTRPESRRRSTAPIALPVGPDEDDESTPPTPAAAAPAPTKVSAPDTKVSATAPTAPPNKEDPLGRPNPPRPNPERPNPERPNPTRPGAKPSAASERALAAVRSGSAVACTAAEWPEVKAALQQEMSRATSKNEFGIAQSIIAEMSRLSAAHAAGAPPPPAAPSPAAASEPAKHEQPADAPLGRPVGWRPY